jgi:two-component system, NarL family, invasion response regulator UvrY
LTTGRRPSHELLSLRHPIIMIRVFVADDHSIMREGLKQIAAETNDIRITGEASNGRAAISALGEGVYDVLVMDLSMPEGGGLETLRHVRAIYPKLPVLILSMYPEDQYAIRVLKAGAAGYLSKEAAPDSLLDAVRKVAGGGKFISQVIAEKLAFQVGAPITDLPHDKLSEREFQVFRMLAEGKSVSEIGDELALSVKTVSTYRTRLLEKMDMRSNAEITRYALDNHLVQ